MRLEERADADAVACAAAELGVRVPRDLVLWRVGAEWHACGIGTSAELLDAAAILNRLDGRAPVEYVAPESDTRPLAERLAEYDDPTNRPTTAMWNMGYELRRWLREALGSDISGLPRAVALEIADDANDTTRASHATLEKLVRWTGAKNERVVRDAIQRLGAAGWEFRVPMGTGKDGRALYAVPGKALRFKVPGARDESDQVAEGTVKPCPLPEGTVKPSEGTVRTYSDDDLTVTEDDLTVPLSSVPSDSSSLSRGAPDGARPGAQAPEREKDPIASILTAEHGASPDEAAAILTAVRSEGTIRSETAWVTSARGRTDIAARLAALRRAPTRLRPRPELAECVKCCDPITGPVAPDGLCRPCRTKVPA